MTPGGKKKSLPLRVSVRLMWEDVSIDRTGLAAGPPSWWIHVAAWASIGLVYVWGWGDGLANAFAYLAAPWTPSDITDASVPGLLASIGKGLAIVAMTLVLIWMFRRYARLRVKAASLGTVVRTIPLALLASLTGFGAAHLVAGWFHQPGLQYPRAALTGELAPVLSAVDVAMAGPMEELALVALVATALRVAGYRWWVVVLVAVALRVPFHLYYGWSALTLALWAALAMLLYRRTKAILALILEHSLINVLNFSAPEVSMFVIPVMLLAVLPIVARHFARVEKRGVDAIVDN